MAWDPRVTGSGVQRRRRRGVCLHQRRRHQDLDACAGGTLEPVLPPLSVSQQDPLRMVTGLQDQGSIRTWTAGTEPTDLTQWNSYFGGDGHWVQINPRNQNVYYAWFQPSPPAEDCAKFTDSGTTTQTFFSNPFRPTLIMCTSAARRSRVPASSRSRQWRPSAWPAPFRPRRPERPRPAARTRRAPAQRPRRPDRPMPSRHL
jgi:hypothetical protein